jgi:hypothetical protein
LMSNTMSLLKEWPPADDALPLHQSHLIVTFGPPISQEFRSSRMQEHFERMTSLEGWSIYTPDRCADEVRDDCGVYGALFSSSDMYIFDELLNQLRAIERENAFLSENDLPFSSLFITNFRDSSRGYVGKSISKKKKVQSVLVHRKPKVSAFIKEKWERERSERRAERKKYSDEYNDRLLTDKAFAKRVMERHIAEKEREKQKKIDRKQKQQRDEDTQILFENFFGEKMIWGPMAVTYREKYHTAYMPIGGGRFLFQRQIVRKADLYEVCTVPNNSKTGTMVPIREPLLGCNLMFADGKTLPMISDFFDAWYRSLPIHKTFLDGMETEIRYLAPDNLQPDFPFVYLDWNVDCGSSSDDDEDDRWCSDIFDYSD